MHQVLIDQALADLFEDARVLLSDNTYRNNNLRSSYHHIAKAASHCAREMMHEPDDDGFSHAVHVVARLALAKAAWDKDK